MPAVLPLCERVLYGRVDQTIFPRGQREFLTPLFAAVAAARRDASLPNDVASSFHTVATKVSDKRIEYLRRYFWKEKC